MHCVFTDNKANPPPSRAAVIQAADDEVQPRHHAERGGVLRVPRRRQRGGQAAGPRGDRALREQALPGVVQGRGLPVPRAVLVLPRHGPRGQAVRDGPEERQRQDVRQVFQVST